MKICMNCNKQYENNLAQFCADCGKELIDEPQLKECPNCGNLIPSVAIKCKYCHHKLSAKQQISNKNEALSVSEPNLLQIKSFVKSWKFDGYKKNDLVLTKEKLIYNISEMSKIQSEQYTFDIFLSDIIYIDEKCIDIQNEKLEQVMKQNGLIRIVTLDSKQKFIEVGKSPLKKEVIDIISQAINETMTLLEKFRKLTTFWEKKLPRDSHNKLIFQKNEYIQFIRRSEDNIDDATTYQYVFIITTKRIIYHEYENIKKCIYVSREQFNEEIIKKIKTEVSINIYKYEQDIINALNNLEAFPINIIEQTIEPTIKGTNSKEELNQFKENCPTDNKATDETLEKFLKSSNVSEQSSLLNQLIKFENPKIDKVFMENAKSEDVELAINAIFALSVSGRDNTKEFLEKLEFNFDDKTNVKIRFACKAALSRYGRATFEELNNEIKEYAEQENKIRDQKKSKSGTWFSVGIVILLIIRLIIQLAD